MSGFKVSSSQSSGDYTGAIREFDVPVGNASILAVGDVVNLTGTSNAVTGVAGIVKASQGAAIAGVIQSFAPNFTTENFTDAGGIAVSTAATAFVAIDTNLMFQVECDATLDAVDVGLNAEALVTAATKSGGLTSSNMQLDSSTKAATATLQFRIHKLLPGATSGVLGDRALVSINASSLQGAGV